MKKVLGTMAALAVAGTIGMSSAQAVDVNFDASGSGTFDATNSLTSFDWVRGNVLADSAVPVSAVGDEFTVYYHARISLTGGGGFGGTNNFNLLTDLNNEGAEVTVVAGFRERVASIAGTTVSFELVNNVDNFFQIYVDTTPDSNEATGAGFNDGVLILDATPDFGQAAANSFTADFGEINELSSNDPTQLTVTGGGSLAISATINSIDGNYLQFDPGMSQTIILSAVSDGNLNLFANAASAFAFRDTDSSSQFWDGSGYVSADLGTINGVDGPDFQFTADASTGFQDAVVPEPMTASLGLLSIGGLLLGTRRRRNA